MAVRHKIQYLFVCVMILGSSVAYHLYTAAPVDLMSKKADYHITANELMDAYIQDETVANELYLNRVLSVTGQISRVELNDRSCSIYLESQSLFGDVIAELSACAGLTDLKSGDQICIKGVCTGYLADVILTRSVIAPEIP